MRRKRTDLSYLRDLVEDKPVDVQKNTPMAKKAVFIIFALFLFSFHKYAPYTTAYVTEKSMMQSIFNIYFFVSNQVFGIVHEGGTWDLLYSSLSSLPHCPQWNNIPAPLSCWYRGLSGDRDNSNSNSKIL